MDMKKMKTGPQWASKSFPIMALNCFRRLVEGGVKEETKQILKNLDTVLQAKYRFS